MRISALGGMTMKKREGFTLAELVLAVFIFSFIATSMATIFSTTNRQMFQNYRRNMLKTNVLLSMRRIQNNISMANRVDLPLPGQRDTRLAFAVNVDQATGCYPINAAVPAGVTSWHYFCLSGNSLYYHTGTIATGAAVPCGNAAPSVWCLNNPIGGGCYNVPSCAGGTLLVQHLDTTQFNGALFSRHTGDGVFEMDTVRVVLRSFWSASAQGFGSSQRDVDSTLDTVVRFTRAY